MKPKNFRAHLFSRVLTLNVFFLLRQLEVSLKRNKQFAIARALLDIGSNSSFISEDLINKLVLINCAEINMCTVTIDISCENQKVKVVQNLTISDIENVNSVPLGYLYSSVGFPISKDNISMQEDANCIPEFG